MNSQVPCPEHPSGQVWRPQALPSNPPKQAHSPVSRSQIPLAAHSAYLCWTPSTSGVSTQASSEGQKPVGRWGGEGEGEGRRSGGRLGVDFTGGGTSTWQPEGRKGVGEGGVGRGLNSPRPAGTPRGDDLQHQMELASLGLCWTYGRSNLLPGLLPFPSHRNTCRPRWIRRFRDQSRSWGTRPGRRRRGWRQGQAWRT